MNIKKLWEGYKFPMCETCKKDCQGRLDYKNLCSNLNYLKEYGEINFIKNKQSFEILKKIIKIDSPIIFSFGCGIGLDYIGAKEIFNNVKYIGIDECDWAIKDTTNYKNFKPKLPNTINYKNGLFLLNIATENVVLCFFNSLFTISNNTNLLQDLVKVLKNKTNFYIVCDFTINNTYHMPSEELEFLNKLTEQLKPIFKISHLKILEEKGIIIVGDKK